MNFLYFLAAYVSFNLFQFQAQYLYFLLQLSKTLLFNESRLESKTLEY